MNSVIELLRVLMGQYVPQTYTEYYFDSVNNVYVPYEVIPEGIASLNIEYLLSAIIFLGMLYFFQKYFYLIVFGTERRAKGRKV